MQKLLVVLLCYYNKFETRLIGFMHTTFTIMGIIDRHNPSLPGSSLHRLHNTSRFIDNRLSAQSCHGHRIFFFLNLIQTLVIHLV